MTVHSKIKLIKMRRRITQLPRLVSSMPTIYYNPFVSVLSPFASTLDLTTRCGRQETGKILGSQAYLNQSLVLCLLELGSSIWSRLC